MTRDRPRLLSGAAALAAALCLLAALARFRGPEAAHGTGWALYWIALALGAAAAWPWRGRGEGSPAASRRELALLAVVLIAGTAFRAFRLGTAPYGVWFDEAQNGLEALRILAEPGYRPVFVPGISQLPALPFFYFAGFLDVFGPGILALRLATTLIGLLAIVATWALGRELFGRRVGLLAAALLALSRWHVTFSRFAVTNLAVTLFLPLVVLLFLRALRRRSPRDAVLCGLALGLGLQSYYAMLAAPLILGALFALEWARGPARGRAPVALFALALATGALAYAPVVQYARSHPQEYGQRLRATSFVAADSPLQAIRLLVPPSPRLGEAWSAVGANLKAHALMFHVRGDANGRHNLPGAPMLDPVAGVLFALGLLWCLARPLDPRRAALLVPFLAMMTAGVLSLTFEAPQGARTLGAVPFVALLGALPLAALARVAADRRGPRAAFVVSGVALAGAGLWSWRVFDRQLRDPSAWESYSTPETHIAEVVRAHGDADVYVPPTLAGGPTITFLLGEPLRATPFERSRDLPLPDHGRSAIVFLLGSEDATVAQVRALYPQGSIEPFGAPLPSGAIDHAVLWTARVPAEAIAGLEGWEVDDGRTVRTVRGTEWTWSDPPSTTRVRGVLRMPEDQARVFATEGAPASLSIDGEPVLDARAATSGALQLARGMHEVELAVPAARGATRTILRWRTTDGAFEPIPSVLQFLPRVPAGGLLGEYHAGPEPIGTPAFRRIDPQVAFYFHLLPLPRPFSVRWSGSVYAPAAGTYQLGTTAVDESSIDIDGRALVATPRPNVHAEREVELEQGWHAIDVRYRALTDYSQVELLWVRPEGARERVPAAMLRPPGPGGRRRARDAPAPEVPELRRAAEAPAPTGDAAPALAVRATRAIPPGRGRRIAAADDGRVFVLDPASKRVWLVGAKGPPAPVAPAREPWIDPSDLAVAADGRLHVLDAGGFVATYSPRLQPERTLDLRALGVYNPRGLALSAGQVLIADTGGGRILVLDGDARLQAVVGRPGHGDGELADPVDVARDSDGGLVVVDAGNGRIVRFARDGRVEAWPRTSDRMGTEAERLDVAADGTVWMAGGGLREAWSLTPGRAPRRHALPGVEAPDALATAGRRLFLLTPEQVLEVAP